MKPTIDLDTLIKHDDMRDYIKKHMGDDPIKDHVYTIGPLMVCPKLIDLADVVGDPDVSADKKRDAIGVALVDVMRDSVDSRKRRFGDTPRDLHKHIVDYKRSIAGAVAFAATGHYFSAWSTIKDMVSAMYFK